MKRFIIILSLISIKLFAQPVINYNSFPVNCSDSTPLMTSDLLNLLNWEAIKKFCDTTKGFYAKETQDEYITTYEHSKRGGENGFIIGSFQGKVVYFNADVKQPLKECNINYFDKNIWASYINFRLPDLNDSMKLSISEPEVIHIAYYKLLGIRTRDEYGWICEYSTVGMEPDKRLAVIDLIKYSRYDLLRKIIKFSNPQSQLYAADALILLDYFAKADIKIEQNKINKLRFSIDSVNKSGSNDTTKVEYLKYFIGKSEDMIEYYKETGLITEDDWNAIYELRDSRKKVYICGNRGSYKLYESNSFDLLSDENISKIPDEYKNLRDRYLDGIFTYIQSNLCP